MALKQPQSLIRSTLRLGVLLVGCSSLGLSVYTGYIGYEGFTATIASFFKRPEVLDRLRSDYLSAQAFLAFVVFMGFVGLGLISYYRGLAAYLYHLWAGHRRLVVAELRLLHTHWYNSPQSHQNSLLLVWGLVGLGRLAAIAQFPVLLDEAFTAVYFVHPGVLVSAVYYPGPNNHLLYSTLSAILYQVSGQYLPLLWSLRLPTWVANQLLSLGLAWYAYRRFGQQLMPALLAMLLWQALQAPLLYAILGRGYMLAWLFFWMAYLQQAHWHKPQRRRRWILYNLLALWVIPVMLYPCLALWLLALTDAYRRKQLSVWMVMGLRVGVGTALVYAPVVAFNGAVLWQNHWVSSPYSLEQWLAAFPAYYLRLWDYLSADGLGWLLCLFCLFQWLRRPAQYRLALGFLILSTCFLAVQQVLPPERVWGWMCIPVLLTIVDTSAHWRSKVSVILLIAPLLLLAWGAIQLQHETRSLSHWHRLCQKAAQTPAKQIYCPEDEMFVFLKYHQILQATQPSAIIDRMPEKKPYDLLILNQERTKTFNFTPASYFLLSQAEPWQLWQRQ
jgi:hypothetical protein